VDVVPPFKGEAKLPHPLPVPWEDVWVSSSDGTWTFDKVVERKELDEDHFHTSTHGIMTRKSEGWLWDYFDVRTTKNDRVYQPAPAALETPAMCPKCSSTDLDERGNCYACLASASEPAPQPAEAMRALLDKVEACLDKTRWERDEARQQLKALRDELEKERRSNGYNRGR
jgi:molybdenum cofactor biosynthesis enzyme MoaA